MLARYNSAVKPCSGKAAVLLLSLIGAATAQDAFIDVQRSTISIHVSRAGVLSVAGHDHTIAAPISSGTIRESASPRVEFTIEAAKIAVQPDPKVDAKTQAQIQKDMQEMTLETRKFPRISFRSSRVDKLAGEEWKVEGDLSLHGITKPVVLSVRRAGDSYTGHATLKQTDFGIRPISVGGGMIKVKDQVDIAFAIVVRR
jgi:polyisoprenoid-binding protein YceI